MILNENERRELARQMLMKSVSEGMREADAIDYAANEFGISSMDAEQMYRAAKEQADSERREERTQFLFASTVTGLGLLVGVLLFLVYLGTGQTWALGVAIFVILPKLILYLWTD